MDFILYVDNMPRGILYWEKDIIDFFRQTPLTQNLSTLWAFLEQKVILKKDFEDLQKNINIIKEAATLVSFRWIEDSLGDHLESAEDCIYLRRKTIDIRLFLETVIEQWQKGWQKGDYEESAVNVIKERFMDLESHGFYINDDDNEVTLAEVVYQEVMDCWGGLCWQDTELTLNDMNPFYRNKIDLKELVLIIYYCCMENCC